MLTHPSATVWREEIADQSPDAYGKHQHAILIVFGRGCCKGWRSLPSCVLSQNTNFSMVLSQSLRFTSQTQDQHQSEVDLEEALLLTSSPTCLTGVSHQHVDCLGRHQKYLSCSKVLNTSVHIYFFLFVSSGKVFRCHVYVMLEGLVWGFLDSMWKVFLSSAYQLRPRSPVFIARSSPASRLEIDIQPRSRDSKLRAYQMMSKGRLTRCTPPGRGMTWNRHHNNPRENSNMMIDNELLAALR